MYREQPAPNSDRGGIPRHAFAWDPQVSCFGIMRPLRWHGTGCSWKAPSRGSISASLEEASRLRRMPAFIDGRVDVYSAEAFERKLRTVAELISRSDRVSRPELWFLGSSDSRHRGESAARLQAHFALSLILTPTPPSALPICAYRETEARLGLEPGNAVIAFPLACLESPRDRANYRSPHSGVRGATFVHTAARCRERIEELCHLYNVNEVCILESSAGIERRGASLRMLAEAFGGLAGPPAKGRVPSPGELD